MGTEPGWLRQEFERARKRSEVVPPHARPVLVKRPPSEPPPPSAS